MYRQRQIPNTRHDWVGVHSPEGRGNRGHACHEPADEPEPLLAFDVWVRLSWAVFPCRRTWNGRVKLENEIGKCSSLFRTMCKHVWMLFVKADGGWGLLGYGGRAPWWPKVQSTLAGLGRDQEVLGWIASYQWGLKNCFVNWLKSSQFSFFVYKEHIYYTNYTVWSLPVFRDRVV